MIYTAKQVRAEKKRYLEQQEKSKRVKESLELTTQDAFQAAGKGMCCTRLRLVYADGVDISTKSSLTVAEANFRDKVIRELTGSPLGYEVHKEDGGYYVYWYEEE